MAQLSLAGATRTLKMMFGAAESDCIAIEDVYRNVDRDKDNPSDRAWLYNQLSSMRRCGLLEKEYGTTRRGRRIIKGLRLTARGRLAVQADLDADQLSARRSEDRSIALARWKADSRALQALYPEFEVIYDIRLREE